MCELLAQGPPCPRHEPRVTAHGYHTLKRFDGSWVVRLKPDLVGRDTANSWTGVVQHPFHERSQDVDGQWV